jgi:outer membrane immunogenic protein
MGVDMKKLFLSSVAISALMMSPPGQAADLPVAVKAAPPVPVYSWTGCAIGLQGGWGVQRNRIKQTQFSTNSSGGRLFVFSAASNGNVDTSGAVFGAQAGCDYQFAATPWVIGVQGMFLGSDINGVRQDPMNGVIQTITPAGGPFTPFPLGGGSIGVRTRYLESVTARLGWAGWNPETLLYVKGGAAWANTQLDMRNSAAGPFFLFPRSPLFDNTYGGWTVGGGVEWKIAANWSAFVEGNYYQFDNKTLASLAGTPGVRLGNNINGGTLDSDVRIVTATVGINYRFNWGAPAVVAKY